MAPYSAAKAAIIGLSQALAFELAGERTLWISIVPVMSDDDACTGVVGLFKDTTEIENLERMRRDYIANISHELRTPLTAVKGLLEPLSDGLIADEETRQRYYGIMLHEVERLSRLITDMLQLSRLQAGTEYMERSIFDVNELLEDVLNSYANAAAKRNMKLVLHTQELPPVISDQDRIEQVLVILIDNALHYAGEGKTVTVSARQDASDVFVSVTDDGCGISGEDITHIFERFYKASKARNEGGTGLGLSIAKQVMDKLGETLEVKSELGKGTQFTLSIKKYVSNAIPLGPVDSDAIILHDFSDPQTAAESDAASPYVAPFEVLEPQKKPDGRKRR